MIVKSIASITRAFLHLSYSLSQGILYPKGNSVCFVSIQDWSKLGIKSHKGEEGSHYIFHRISPSEAFPLAFQESKLQSASIFKYFGLDQCGHYPLLHECIVYKLFGPKVVCKDLDTYLCELDIIVLQARHTSATIQSP